MAGNAVLGARQRPARLEGLRTGRIFTAARSQNAMARKEVVTCDWCGRLCVGRVARIVFGSDVAVHDGRSDDVVGNDLCGRCADRVERVALRVTERVRKKKAALAAPPPVIAAPPVVTGSTAPAPASSSAPDDVPGFHGLDGSDATPAPSSSEPAHTDDVVDAAAEEQQRPARKRR